MNSTNQLTDIQKVAVKKTFAESVLRSIESFLGKKAVLNATEKTMEMADRFVEDVQNDINFRENIREARRLS